MTHSERVGRRVRAELYEHGTSANAMAAKIGMSQSAMSARISGVVDFRISELEAIAAELDVPITQLLPPVTDPDLGTRRLAGGPR
jgi:transcriptional regulator with XRE-family HTH domain